jgi:hypothetical protein
MKTDMTSACSYQHVSTADHAFLLKELATPCKLGEGHSVNASAKDTADIEVKVMPCSQNNETKHTRNCQHNNTLISAKQRRALEK